VKDDDVALVGRELGKGQLDLLTLVDPVLRCVSEGMHRFEGGDVERRFAPPPALAKILGTEIESDGEEPRAERGPRTKVVTTAVQLQESLLHEVLRFLPAVDAVQHEPKQDGRITPEERSEGRVLAPDVGGHQLFVVRRQRCVVQIVPTSLHRSIGSFQHLMNARSGRRASPSWLAAFAAHLRES
jgi:hypothetical protein